MTKKIKKTEKISKEGYTRIQAFASAIQSKKSGKIEALIVEANKRGKADNLKESTTVVKWALKVLEAMKLATIEGDSYKLS
jgi:hypothetical protein